MERNANEPIRVVFVMSEYSLHNAIVEDYLAARPDDVVSLVKVPLVLRGRGRRETMARIAPRLSRRFLAAKLAEAALVTGVTWTPKVGRRGAVFRRLRWIAARRRLPFLRVEDIMSERALEFVRAQRPDVVLTLFHQIVRRDLLLIPRMGIVNAHPGLLPEFAGIQPYFWASSEGAREAGATLHLIEDESVDTGRVVARASFPVQPGMSVQLAYYLTCRAIARLLPPTVEAWAAGTLEPRSQTGTGAYRRWPDSVAMDALERRGHSVFSLREFGGILLGRYDGFSPERMVIHRREG